jgi:hypothetical protein
LYAHQRWNKFFETEFLTHDDMQCKADCTRREHEAVVAMNEKEYDEYTRTRDTG